MGKSWEQMTERERDGWVAEWVVGMPKHEVRASGTDRMVTVYGQKLSDGNWSEADLLYYGQPPLYTTDLNHAAEAEAEIERRGLIRAYTDHLALVVSAKAPRMKHDAAMWRYLVRATAAQRCEAMWRTVGGEQP